jgi:hypothetical protein
LARHAIREGFALFENHPIARGFPDGRFRELSLIGLGTDTALSWIEPDRHMRDVQPVITRIDARESMARHYIGELKFGRGTLIVTTLRVEWGIEKQPSGLAAGSAALCLVDKHP